MAQKDEQLLLKDLCARLSYGVKVQYNNEIYNIDYISALYTEVKLDIPANYTIGIFEIKPYLRPMSSMTEEEKEELLNLLFDKEAKYFYIDEGGLIDGKTSDLMKEGLNYPAFCPINIELYTDWLNVHHFDYRGLIEKGLALKAPKGIYD